MGNISTNIWNISRKVFCIWNRYILKYFVKAPHWKLLSLVFSRRLQNFAGNFQQIFKIFKARNYKGIVRTSCPFPVPFICQASWGIISTFLVTSFDFTNYKGSYRVQVIRWADQDQPITNQRKLWLWKAW